MNISGPKVATPEEAYYAEIKQVESRLASGRSNDMCGAKK
jgi:hypothetical protein